MKLQTYTVATIEKDTLFWSLCNSVSVAINSIKQYGIYCTLVGVNNYTDSTVLIVAYVYVSDYADVTEVYDLIFQAIQEDVSSTITVYSVTGVEVYDIPIGPSAVVNLPPIIQGGYF